MNKKKRVVATASAVALAAMLAFGGTLAYYQGQAESPVENTLVDQGNSVTISETDEDGETTYSNTYSIIPGTTDKKDPVVTAEFTLDSYVYVKADDTTEGWIEWAIANGWAKLDGYDDVYYLLLKTVSYDETSSEWTETSTNSGEYTYTEDGLTYTYKGTSDSVGSYTVSKDDVQIYTYTAAAAGETTLYTASIPVIDGDTITYSSGITNETFDGYGSTVSLDFTAYIIQAWLTDGTDEDDDYGEKEYSSPTLAYYYADPDGYYESAVANGNVAAINETVYSTLESAVSAAADGETVTLLTDIKATAAVTYSDTEKSITLDLNGNTITNSGTESYVLSVAGGTLTIADSAETGAISGNKSSQVGIQLTGGTLNVTSGTISGSSGILISGGTLNVSGGAVTGISESYETVSKTYDSENVNAYKDTVDSLTAVNGSGIFIVAGNDNNLTVNISGGTISTADYDNNHDICVVKLTDCAALGVTINVTGGTFGGKVGDNQNYYLAYDWENNEEYSWITLSDEKYLLGGMAGKYMISGGTGLSAGWIGVNGASPY